MTHRNSLNVRAKRFALLATLAALTLPAAAQDEDPELGESGYAKVYIEVKAIPADKTGKVIKLVKTTTGGLWKDDAILPAGTSDALLKAATIEITDGGGSLYLWVRDGQTDATYKPALFYLDDGDGTFDATKDAELPVGGYGGDVMIMPNMAPSSSAYTHQIIISSSLLDVYQTEAVAVASTLPDKPHVLIYAFYSNGDFVAVKDGMGAFGTATVSNLANQPGDNITLTATPEPGYEFAYWKSADQGGEKLSTANPWTLTAVGGQTYYAVFYEQGAPTLDFPQEGGFMLMPSDKYWVADEMAEFTNYILAASDIVTNGGKTTIDTSNDAAKFSMVNRNNEGTWYWNHPNLLYGKGSVKMAYSKTYGEGRGETEILYWTSKQLKLTGSDVNSWLKTTTGYVFLWNADLQAFLPWGTTAGGQTVTIPAQSAYLLLTGESAATLPAIGLTAKAYDNALALPLTTGDANGDGQVDRSDLTRIIAHIMGSEPWPFYTNGADANADGRIDIADVTAIINILMTGK